MVLARATSETLGVWALPDRPLRDGLPALDASRGGLTFVPPPDLGALAGATGIWTAATDVNPLGATKPIISVVCGVPATTYVDAVPTRLQFGNMQIPGRYATLASFASRSGNRATGAEGRRSGGPARGPRAE